MTTYNKNAGKLCAYGPCELPARWKGYCNGHAKHKFIFGIEPRAFRAPNNKPYIEKSSGYMYITVDGVRIREHRYLMEQKLGRKLLPEESVHHKNGNRVDNRLENLELWSRSQPAGQRVEDKLTWALEIIEMYS